MKHPTHKTTICENPQCPNTLASEKENIRVFESYCIDINMDIEGHPKYACLPCAYRCGGVA